MQFRLLGPLEVGDGKHRVALPSRRQRTLLAILLSRVNEVLARDQIIEFLWGDEKPRSAANALQVHVSGLRRALGADVLLTKPPGYVLAVEPKNIDASRFEWLAGRAGRSGEPEATSRTLHEALALWRGPAFADFRDAPFAQPHIARLEELRLKALEDRIDADLALGRHGDLVPELESIVVEHPGREHFWTQLMLGLYRAGRQADALAAYRQARRTLVDELGIEPSRSLRELERAVLRQDAGLDAGCGRPSTSKSTTRSKTRRKTVTVVAARMVLVGARSDPEAVSKLSASWEREAARGILRHGGQVHRLAGDSVLGLFGASDANEDDAVRAARSATDLRFALDRANGDLESRMGVRIESAIGLSTGELLVGPERGAVAGQSLHAAAALADTAPPGEIHLDDPTKVLLGGAAAIEADDTREGARRWRLLAVSQPGQRSPLRLEASMVGRAVEITRLGAVLETVVRERRARLVLVTGPAGIGKSRLAAEFRGDIESRATIVSGRCVPYGEGITFWPLAEVVRQAAGDVSADALARFLRGEPDAAIIAAQIAAAIGTGRPGAGSEETFWAARRFLERLARRRPVILILEDLHWADDTFLQLVEHVVDWAADAPILVLGLTRPELLAARPSLRAKANAEQIRLYALEDEDVRTLVRQLAGRRVRVSDRNWIIEASGGNPLFIEELALTLHTRREGTPAIPPTVHALIAARLDRLGELDRALLEIAAVIGTQFSTDALEALSPPGPQGGQLAEHLAGLISNEFIRTQRGAFTFRHILVRDAAYAAIPKARRADLHERFAEWLAGEAGPRVSEYEEIVGYHLEQAVAHRRAIGAFRAHERALAGRAATHLAKAGRRAYSRDDRAAETRLLSRAVALLEHGDPRRGGLGPELAEALRETGDFAAACRLLEELAAEEGTAAAAARGRLVRLRIDLQTEAGFHLAEVEHHAAKAAETLEAEGDNRWLARAWELLAWVPYLRCRAGDAEGPLDQALRRARAAGDLRQETRLLSLLFSVVIYGPLPVAEGVVRCERALEDGVVGRTRASALRVLASLRAMEGDFAAGRRFLREDRRLLRELGLPLVAARASVAYGQFELLAGDPERAERELRRGLAQLQRFGERGALSNVAAVLSQALCEQGRHEEALELSELAKDAAGEEDMSAQVYWRMPRGRALTHLGDVAAGHRLLRSAAALARRTDFLNTQAESLAYLGMALGDSHLLERAAKLYNRKGNLSAEARLRRLALVS